MRPTPSSVPTSRSTTTVASKPDSTTPGRAAAIGTGTESSGVPLRPLIGGAALVGGALLAVTSRRRSREIS
jgi:hypothetical protein